MRSLLRYDIALLYHDFIKLCTMSMDTHTTLLRLYSEHVSVVGKRSVRDKPNIWQVSLEGKNNRDDARGYHADGHWHSSG